MTTRSQLHLTEFIVYQKVVEFTVTWELVTVELVLTLSMTGFSHSMGTEDFFSILELGETYTS